MSVWSPVGVSRGYSQINNRPSEKYRPLRNQPSKTPSPLRAWKLCEELPDGVSAVHDAVLALGPQGQHGRGLEHPAVRVEGAHALGVLVLDGPVPFVEYVADLLVGVVRRHFCALLVFVHRRVAFGAGLGTGAPVPGVCVSVPPRASESFESSCVSGHGSWP
jgi:hypothetical protein